MAVANIELPDESGAAIACSSEVIGERDQRAVLSLGNGGFSALRYRLAGYARILSKVLLTLLESGSLLYLYAGGAPHADGRYTDNVPVGGHRHPFETGYKRKTSRGDGTQ